jgi:hypothetical protein
MDFEKLAAAAVESFLDGDQEGAGESREPKRHRLRGAGAVALGVGLAVAGHAAYTRVRNFDLEQFAGAVEERLKR